MENWKVIVIDGVEMSYDISDLGRVRSRRTQNAKILKDLKNPQGYSITRLYDDTFGDGWRQFSVHRLVFSMFNFTPPTYSICGKLLDIDHLDGNRANNSLDNLQLITHVDNVRKSECGRSRKSVVGKDDDGNIVESFNRKCDGVPRGFWTASINIAIRTKKKYRGLYWEHTTPSAHQYEEFTV